MVVMSYTQARDHLAEVLDKAVHDREVIVISRRNREDVCVIAASELSGLLETAHLFRSPKNVERLRSAIERARAGEEDSESLDDLRSELGL